MQPTLSLLRRSLLLVGCPATSTSRREATSFLHATPPRSSAALPLQARKVSVSLCVLLCMYRTGFSNYFQSFLVFFWGGGDSSSRGGPGGRQGCACRHCPNGGNLACILQVFSGLGDLHTHGREGALWPGIAHTRARTVTVTVTV
jgi:hypothetical protein